MIKRDLLTARDAITRVTWYASEWSTRFQEQASVTLRYNLLRNVLKLDRTVGNWYSRDFSLEEERRVGFKKDDAGVRCCAERAVLPLLLLGATPPTCISAWHSGYMTSVRPTISDSSDGHRTTRELFETVTPYDNVLRGTVRWRTPRLFPR